jgi:hypothetical protein
MSSDRFKAWEKKIMAAEQEVFSVVKPIIDKYDPSILLRMGAPSDEYDSECKKIAEVIVREGFGLGYGSSLHFNEEELGNLIAFVWHMEFGQWSRRPQYLPHFYEMAREILPQLPKQFPALRPNHHKDEAVNPRG